MNMPETLTNVFMIPYDTIKEIPLSEYKNLHKKYWTFIANNHLDYKPCIVGKHKNRLFVKLTCFACQYARYGFKKHICPIKCFRNKDGHCGCCSGTLYKKWLRSSMLDKCQEKADEIALQIANLEWEDYRDGD